MSLVRSAKKPKDPPAPACTRKCCEYCPDEGDIHKKCEHPSDWDDDWDEEKICADWKHIGGYHLWGYT